MIANKFSRGGDPACAFIRKNYPELDVVFRPSPHSRTDCPVHPSLVIRVNTFQEVFVRGIKSAWVLPR